MRLVYIDIAKGLGLFLVILGHIIQLKFPENYGENSMRMWIYSFHMPLFFFLSGAVFRFGIGKGGIRKVIIHLIIPYCIFILCGLFISFAIPQWHPKSVKSVMVEIFYLVTPNALHMSSIWFLFCLAIVQIMFILLRCLKLDLKWEIVIVVIFMTISFLVTPSKINWLKIPFTHINIPRLPFKLDTAFMALSFFYTGNKMMIHKKIDQLVAMKLKNKILLLFFMLFINIIFGTILNKTIDLADNFYNNLFYFIIAAYSGIFVVLLVSTIIGKMPIIEFYGINSLPVFSFHFLFLYVYEIFSDYIYKGDDILAKYISTVIGMIFVLILSVPVQYIYKMSVPPILNKVTKKIIGNNWQNDKTKAAT
jgi:fucose 4-O-acetylase-like acetyltransferase